MRIILTGGGSGGHLMPLVAVANKIKERVPDTEFLFVGPKGNLENIIIGKAGIPMKHVLAGKMRRYFSIWNIIDFFKAPLGILQALWVLLVYMPDAIFSKGGYASLPVVIAGFIYRIPVLIHESDSVLGLANSMLGKFATRVAVSYPEAEREFPSQQVVLTGNPLRADIASGDPERARQMFSITESKKVIFVCGGSQGARSINEKITEILPVLLKKYQIIHQTGESNFDTVVRKAGELGIKADREGYHPVAFAGEELKDIYAVSDLVITRASANFLSEIAANGKPAIAIPLQNAANDHQRMNAYSIARSGGCVVLEENNLGEHMLLEKIEEIMNNEDLQRALSENIKQFYHADAADKIAEGVIGMIK